MSRRVGRRPGAAASVPCGNGSGPVTVTEIARRCKVSVATVSNILNGKGPYRPETRQLVRDMAERLGYKANASARTMVTGRFGCYALVLSPKPSASILPYGLLEALDAALAPENLHLILSRLPDADLTDTGYCPKILSSLMVDGLLINYNVGVPDAVYDLLEIHRVPTVWLNHDRPRNAVLPDDLSAGHAAAGLLLKRGHRRLAWLDTNHGFGEPGSHYSQSERREGVRSAVAAAGATVIDLGRTGGIPIPERVPAVMAALRAGPRPTGVVCYSSEAATVVAIAALSLGWNIPRDLSVVTFGDRNLVLGSLAIDLLQIDVAAEGAAAVGMLAGQVRGEAPAAAVRIPFQHQAGDSLAAPRAD